MELHKVFLANNTGVDLSEIGLCGDELQRAVRLGRLPEDVADLFTLKVIEVDGRARGILNWA